MRYGMFYSDNPVLDEMRYTAYMEEQMEKMPKCDYCGNHVEFVRLVPIGALHKRVCPDCIWDRWGSYAEEDAGLVCEYCGKGIGDDELYYGIAGDIVCEDCMDDFDKEREESRW